MSPYKVFLITSSVLICILMFPLSIVNILMGVVQPKTCDNVDIFGLDMYQHLLILGVFGLIYSTIFIFTNILMMLETDTNKFRFVTLIWLTFSIFNFWWFTTEVIILFRSNIECIHDISTHLYIYVSIIMNLTILSFIRDCGCVGDHQK